MSNIVIQDDYSLPRIIKTAASAQTVGAAQVAVPHGLPRTPAVVVIEMTSAGQIWQSAAADAINVYLTADAAARTCNVKVVA